MLRKWSKSHKTCKRHALTIWDAHKSFREFCKQFIWLGTSQCSPRPQNYLPFLIWPITTLTKMGIFLWNFGGWSSYKLTICTDNLREFHQHLLWAVSSQHAPNPQVNLWKSWFFYFDQLPLSQKWEISCEIFVVDAFISWQYAQKIWESFINICYGLLLVSVLKNYLICFWPSLDVLETKD